MIELTKVLYTAKATAEGGREGHTASDDGKLDVKLVLPASMGGPADGVGTNPEQLFAAGYASCFHSALKLVAGAMKVDTSESEVVADVSLGRDDAGAFGLAVRLEVALPAVSREVAQQLIEQAHQVCPYSNATRGNVEVTLEVA